MRRAAFRGALLGVSLLVLTAQADQQVLEVITLGYRQVDEVIPTLRPLLAPGGAVTGTNNRLIVRTTPANMAELKQVLVVIDSRPKQLMISVRQGAIANASRDAASISGTVGGGGITVPRPAGAQRDPGVAVQGGRTHIEARAISSSSGQDAGVMQTVQVLEGNGAFIRVGQSTPITSTQISSTPSGTRITQSTAFVDADTGFYVTPRVSGERVTLEISAQRDRMRNLVTGAVSAQRASTVVSGRLGEWIEVAGSSESAERTKHELLAQRRGERREDRTIMLKVDEVK